MSDIDQIIANGAKTNANFDFGKINESYWKGRDEFYKQDARDTFRDGVPLDGNGQPDFGAISKTFFQKGDIANGLAAANQALTQRKMEYGARLGEKAFPSGGAVTEQPNLPPSPNRSASVAVAPALTRGGTAPQAPSQAGMPQAAPGRGGDQPGSIVGLVSAAGVPDELAGPIIAQVSAMTKTDPNVALNPEMSQRVQQVVQAAAQRVRSGQPQQPTGLAPQGQPTPPQAAPQADFNSRFSAARPGQGSDPTLGGLVPKGRTASQQIDGLSQAIASGMLTPEQAKAYQSRIDAITKAIEPTGPMKEYDKAVSQGFKGTIEDWQNRADENTTERDILTKSLLPRIDKSQEKASAARDDIDVLHRARAELDRPGGIFSGVLANRQLDLAKAAELFGFSSEKITNTEAFRAAAGQRVASLIKAFGSGTAISDGDRKFTADIAAGDIRLDESSIRRLFDIGEKAARLVIERHNGFVDKAVGANKALKDARDTYMVEAPGQYKKPELAAKPGASPTISSKADYDKLPVGSVFTGPDGKPWRKQ